MKKFLLSVFSVCTVLSLFADAVPDLTASLELLGNPTTERWTSARMARSVQDLQVYRGKVYLGTGDWDKNQGPVPMWAYDPVANAFTNEFSSGTDCAELLRVLSDGCLYVPATDPRDSDANVGSVFRRDPDGTWNIFPYYTQKQLPSSSGTARLTIHVFDIEKCGGRLFMAGTGIAASTDNGTTWTKVDNYSMAERYSSLIRCGADLYALGERTAYFENGSLPDSGTVESKNYSGLVVGVPVMWRWNPGNGVFETYTNTWANIAPEFKVKDTALVNPKLNVGSASVRGWHPTPFGDRCLYILGDNFVSRTYGSVTNVAPAGTRPMIAVSGASVDDGTGRKTLKGARIVLPEKTYPIDFCVSGGSAYMLTIAYNSTDENVRHGVWKSTDGVNFTQILAFDYQQVMMSLEYLRGYFYFGVAHKNSQIPLGTLKSGTSEKAGSIYRVRFPRNASITVR